MHNKYVSFVSDEYLLTCVSNLFDTYLKTKKEITKKDFYKNKIDIIKLTFDSKFNNLDEETLIKLEISRQIDKSISNAIGTFHEEVLGGIKGFEKGNNSGYDIKSIDNSLFAEIKNKHNTMNSGASEAVFQKLSRFANENPQAKCYLVQILSTSSFHEKWQASLNGLNYAHDRVYKISGDQFYKLLAKEEEAFFNLYQALPIAIKDFLADKETEIKNSVSLLDEIKTSNKNLIDQIASDNFNYYLGFDKLL